MNDINYGLVKATHLPPAKPIERIWLGIYLGFVTLLNGDTGAGKSLLLLNLAIHAAMNETLWGIPFGLNRPVKVLYVDPENGGNFAKGDGGLTAVRMYGLGKGRPENLMFHNGKMDDGVSLKLSDPEHMAELRELIRDEEIDLLILDPYVNLFAVENENDNPEANKNMTSLVRLSRNTDCAIVLVHHTGKNGEEFGTSNKYGRGASALLGAADAGLTLRVRSSRSGDIGDDDDSQSENNQRSDFVLLNTEKNRCDGDYSKLHLQMAGNGKFNPVTKTAFRNGSETTVRKHKQEHLALATRDLLIKLLENDAERSRGELLKSAQPHGIKSVMFDKVLSSLVAEGVAEVRTGPRGAKLFRLKAKDEIVTIVTK